MTFDAFEFIKERTEKAKKEMEAVILEHSGILTAVSVEKETITLQDLIDKGFGVNKRLIFMGNTWYNCPKITVAVNADYCIFLGVEEDENY